MNPFKVLLAAAAALAALPAAADDAALIERGGYLARIMDCGGCHTPRGPDGALLEEAGLSGGNVGFEIPGLGVFWPPNLTPAKSGLAGWTKDDIVTALRTGARPDGRILAPAMPWPSYAVISDEDAEALATFLLAQTPVEVDRLEPVAPGGAAKAPFYRVTLPE